MADPFARAVLTSSGDVTPKIDGSAMTAIIHISPSATNTAYTLEIQYSPQGVETEDWQTSDTMTQDNDRVQALDWAGPYDVRVRLDSITGGPITVTIG